MDSVDGLLVDVGSQSRRKAISSFLNPLLDLVAPVYVDGETNGVIYVLLESSESRIAPLIWAQDGSDYIRVVTVVHRHGLARLLRRLEARYTDGRVRLMQPSLEFLFSARHIRLLVPFRQLIGVVLPLFSGSTIPFILLLACGFLPRPSRTKGGSRRVLLTPSPLVSVMSLPIVIKPFSANGKAPLSVLRAMSSHLQGLIESS